MKKPIPVILVEPRVLVREALVCLLHADDRLRLILATASPVDAAQTAEQCGGVLAISAVSLADYRDWGFLGDRATPTGAAVVIGKLVLDRPEVSCAFAAKEDVDWHDSGADLADAILRAGAAEKSGTADLAASEPLAEKGLEALSVREYEVMFIVEGKPNSTIAEALGVDSRTVTTYRRRIMEKLGTASDVGLVRFAIRAGIIAA